MIFLFNRLKSYKNSLLVKFLFAFQQGIRYIGDGLISFCDLKSNQQATEHSILWPFFSLRRLWDIA